MKKCEICYTCLIDDNSISKDGLFFCCVDHFLVYLSRASGTRTASELESDIQDLQSDLDNVESDLDTSESEKEFYKEHLEHVSKLLKENYKEDEKKDYLQLVQELVTYFENEGIV